MNTTKQKLRSLELYLSAHPDNEENSECADRLSDVQELLKEIPDNESAIIKRNEELEAMLEEYQKCRNYKDDDWKEAIDGFRKLDKKITKLLNKNLKPYRTLIPRTKFCKRHNLL